MGACRSAVFYTAAEVRDLELVRVNIESQASLDLRDMFLCHAWDDRQGSAKDLYDLLKAQGVKVWFSEEDKDQVCRAKDQARPC